MGDETLDTNSISIKVEGLSKSFGNHLVLKEIEFEVKQGETVVILGPNGAGKTTLIKVLATIMNPSSGKVMINSLDIKNDAEKVRRSIGVITHQTFLYSNLTACENLEFYSRMYDVPGARERIREVIALVDMTPRLNDRVGILSRGMQQRLSIARSLLHKPPVMLLDEPETGLDQQAISILWEILKTGQENKPTIVFTTHNLEKALRVGDQMLILDQGRIVYHSLAQGLELADLSNTYHHYTTVIS